MHPAVPVIVVLAPFLVWRVWWRIRRTTGRQRLRPARLWGALLLLPPLLLLIAVVALRSAPALEALAAGTLGGMLLALWNTRLTHLEHSAEGGFYTPNTGIGLALTLLVAARLAYHALYFHGDAVAGDAPQPADLLVSSPLTLFIIALRLAYGAAYAAGLLRLRRVAGRKPATAD